MPFDAWGDRLPSQRPGDPEPVTPGSDERPGPVPEAAVAATTVAANVVFDEVRTRTAARPNVTDLVTSAYDAFERQLYAFALGITRSGSAAEDLVQESFLRLVHEVQAGRTPDNIRAWLYRVCANLATSRGRRATVATRYLPFLATREVGETPEARHLRLELGTELSAALAALSADERTGLLLSAGGFHGPEIAQIIGRSHGATRTMLTRARMKVQARMSGEADRRA
jgi:RNA polymerase sigma-70 factor (ECF subfamily)